MPQLTITVAEDKAAKPPGSGDLSPADVVVGLFPCRNPVEPSARAWPYCSLG